MTDNYPGNSKKERTPETPDVEERPKVKSVVKTSGTVRAPGIGTRLRQTFVGEDARETGSYLFFDVVIPAIKSMLYDTITHGADRVLFGGRDVIRSGVAQATNRTRTNYSEISTQNAHRRNGGEPGGRQLSRNARATHQFDEIVLETRGDAEMVLDTMQDLISRFHWVTVPEFYELVDVTAQFTDEKWGWSNLSAAVIRPVRGGYVISLPSPEYDG